MLQHIVTSFMDWGKSEGLKSLIMRSFTNDVIDLSAMLDNFKTKAYIFAGIPFDWVKVFKILRLD